MGRLKGGKVKKLFVFVGVSIAAFTAAAGTPAKEFRDAMALSTFECELRVTEKAQLEGMYGVAPSSAYTAITDCLSKAREKMKQSYDEFLLTSPTPPVKQAAKDLYSATLAYSSKIGTARNQREMDTSTERAEQNKADADFKIEAGI